MRAEVRRAALERFDKKFDPQQARDALGRWSASGASAVREAGKKIKRKVKAGAMRAKRALRNVLRSHVKMSADKRVVLRRIVGALGATVASGLMISLEMGMAGAQEAARRQELSRRGVAMTRQGGDFVAAGRPTEQYHRPMRTPSGRRITPSGVPAIRLRKLMKAAANGDINARIELLSEEEVDRFIRLLPSMLSDEQAEKLVDALS